MPAPKRPDARQLEKLRKAYNRRAQKHAALPPFKHFRHPKEYYQIDYPKDWETGTWSENEDAVAFYKNAEVAVYISVLLGAAKADSEERAELALASLHRTEHAQHVQRDPTVKYVAMRGESPYDPELGQVTRWKILAHDLMLDVAARCPVAQVESLMPIFQRMLASLRVDREMHSQFMQLVHNLLPKIVHLLEEGERPQLDGVSLKCSLGELNLHTALQQVLEVPQALDAITDQIANTLASAKSMSTETLTWEESNASIIPMIKPDGILSAGEESQIDIYAVPWLADLVIVYSIENATSFRMIREEDIDEWDIDTEELHRVAMDNLIAKGELDFNLQPSPDGGVSLGILHTPDSIASSYILRPDVYGQLVGQLGSPIYAALPNRESLVVFHSSTPRAVMLSAVGQDYKNSPYRISDRIFQITPDGVVLT